MLAADEIPARRKSTMTRRLPDTWAYRVSEHADRRAISYAYNALAGWLLRNRPAPLACDLYVYRVGQPNPTLVPDMLLVLGAGHHYQDSTNGNTGAVPSDGGVIAENLAQGLGQANDACTNDLACECSVFDRRSEALERGSWSIASWRPFTRRLPHVSTPARCYCWISALKGASLVIREGFRARTRGTIARIR